MNTVKRSTVRNSHSDSHMLIPKLEDIQPRFALRQGSSVGAYRMQYTIVDLEKPSLDIDGNQLTYFMTTEFIDEFVCECETEEQANLVLSYLNGYHRISVQLLASVRNEGMNPAHAMPYAVISSVSA